MTLLVPIVANAAASLIGAAATSLAQTAQPAPATPENGGAGFGEMLRKIANEAVDTVRAGEAAALGGVQGQLPMHVVVDRVMNAERELHTMIALRDKAVNAFQEISRMSI